MGLPDSLWNAWCEDILDGIRLLSRYFPHGAKLVDYEVIEIESSWSGCSDTDSDETIHFQRNPLLSSDFVADVPLSCSWLFLVQI